MAGTIHKNTGVTLTDKVVHESGELACIYPQRYADLKREIIKKEDEAAVIKAWNEILAELEKTTKEFAEKKSSVIPQVEYSELHQLSPEKIAEIKLRGCVQVKNIIDDDQVLRWKEQLREYVTINPGVEGVPKNNPQFYEIYWSKPQLQARSNPNVLDTCKFLNNLWHTSGDAKYPLSLNHTLSNTNRFRIRQPSDEIWTRLCPHIDGGSVERLEDEAYRTCFEKILKGSWRSHDPFAIDLRLAARTNLYGHQAGITTAWQGWLALSDTGPGEGTLQVFPDVILSISYLILRPFFRMVDPSSPKPLDPSNWVLDLTNPDFPGVATKGTGFGPIRLSDETHPHIRVNEALVSVPRVKPGDMMFWHPDVIHAVEPEHHGNGDSSVMYIAAVPLTVKNMQYIIRQRKHFYEGTAGPSFVQSVGEARFINKGELEDIPEGEGRRAMGLEKFDEKDGDTAGEKEIIRIANEMIATPA